MTEKYANFYTVYVPPKAVAARGGRIIVLISGGLVNGYSKQNVMATFDF